MKKSINIGLIIFLLLQACSGTENIENQSQDKETSNNNQPSPPGGNKDIIGTQSKELSTIQLSYLG